MRILFLDDMQARHDAAARWFEGQELVAVCTAHAAIEALRGPKFDLVMLDHDLAEEHYLTLSQGLSEEPMHDEDCPVAFAVPGEGECLCGTTPYAPGTGMDVVDFLVEQRKSNVQNTPGFIIVHSWNPARAPEMHRRLSAAGYGSYRVPFNPHQCPIKF